MKNISILKMFIAFWISSWANTPVARGFLIHPWVIALDNHSTHWLNFLLLDSFSFFFFIIFKRNVRFSMKKNPRDKIGRYCHCLQEIHFSCEQVFVFDGVNLQKKDSHLANLLWRAGVIRVSVLYLFLPHKH